MHLSLNTWLLANFTAGFRAVLLCLCCSVVRAEPPLQILSLGDSYTIGTSVEEVDRWPNLLQRHLVADGYSVATPEIIARNGWTTTGLLMGLSVGTQREQYNWVTLLIGVNNQFQERSLRGFASELEELIKRSISLAGGEPQRVLVLTIPDWGVSPMGQRVGAGEISREIGRFNQVLIERVEMAGVQLVDIRRMVERARGDRTYLASDRLHFSRKMHNLWAAKAASVIRSAIE